jgi:hypothetical protein
LKEHPVHHRALRQTVQLRDRGALPCHWTAFATKPIGQRRTLESQYEQYLVGPINHNRVGSSSPEGDFVAGVCFIPIYFLVVFLLSIFVIYATSEAKNPKCIQKIQKKCTKKCTQKIFIIKENKNARKCTQNARDILESIAFLKVERQETNCQSLGVSEHKEPDPWA